jgi:hypothetical protein
MYQHLVHACLEGPEAGVYYRGESEIVNDICTTITLPDYVSEFAWEFTVQITPIYQQEPALLSVTKVENNQFKVYGKNSKFFWHVYGKRSDIIVEPNKSDVTVKGHGPYKYF